VALTGAQIRAECGVGSRTQQITRKRLYTTLDLQRHKSLMAMTTPRRPFYVITRKEIACSARLAFYGMAGECAASKSAGNAGMRPATHTTGAYPRPRLFERAGLHEFWGRMQSEGNKSAFLSPRGVCAGRGASAPQASELLPFTEVKINCNRALNPNADRTRWLAQPRDNSGNSRTAVYFASPCGAPIAENQNSKTFARESRNLPTNYS
jgi:hypothetical protein